MKAEDEMNPQPGQNLGRRDWGATAGGREKPASAR